MTAYVLGLSGDLYYSTGTYSTPVWVLVDTVGDLDQQFEDDEADATSRAGGGEEWVLGAISKKTVETDIVADTTDTAWIYLQGQAFTRPRPIFEILTLNGPHATMGNQGLRVSVSLMKFGRTEKLKEIMKSPVTFRPGPAPNPAAWFTS